MLQKADILTCYRQAYSKQLLEMARHYPNEWNYGNAIFSGNLVLGRVASREEDVAQAGEYLLAAAGTRVPDRA